jgi:hypothetical protein
MRTVLCFRSNVAYNLLILRKPVGIVLSLLLLALAAPLSAQQVPSAAHVSRLPLIIPFESTFNTAGTDWSGESFPEVIITRLSSQWIFHHESR